MSGGCNIAIPFLTALTINVLRFWVHFSCFLRVLRRGSISAHVWYVSRTRVFFRIVGEPFDPSVSIFSMPRPFEANWLLKCLHFFTRYLLSFKLTFKAQAGCPSYIFLRLFMSLSHSPLSNLPPDSQRWRGGKTGRQGLCVF